MIPGTVLALVPAGLAQTHLASSVYGSTLLLASRFLVVSSSGLLIYGRSSFFTTTGMFATLLGLFILHRRHRDQEREKRVQYWREQASAPITSAPCLTDVAFCRTPFTKTSCRCEKRLVRPFFRFPGTRVHAVMVACQMNRMLPFCSTPRPRLLAFVILPMILAQSLTTV